MRKPKKPQLLFLIILSLTVVVIIHPNLLTKADSNDQFIQILSMSKEYINYTITSHNEQLWAKVYGKYPIKILNYSTHSQMDLPMVYPTPPNTTHIHINLNGKELEWSNYSQSYPEALHHTAIGDWPMIQCIIENVSDSFLLEIQYEHPIQQINKSNMFLYDLNIKPYLSTQSPNSTAYFTINFETEITNLQAFTTKTDTSWNPINYIEQKTNSTTTITTQIESKYLEPLLGDLVISFNDLNFQGIPPHLLIASIIATSVFTIGTLAYLNKKKRRT